MKKGVQYSHYCGTELQEISSAIYLSISFAKEGNIEDAETWSKYAQEMTTSLRNKIAELDILNGMTY